MSKLTKSIFLLLVISSCSPVTTNETADTEATVSLSGPYLGQTPPGNTPQLFAQGIISTGIHDDGAPRFSADGREVYFRKYAVPHDIVGYMREVDGIWSKPSMFKPFGKYVTGAPMFLPGKQIALLITRMPRSREGDPADYNIWQAEKTEDGWTNIQYLDSPVNTPDGDFAYSVSAKGTIFIQAKYEDTLGNYDFYYSELVDGEYQKAVNMGAPVNTEQSEAAPFIAADESFIVYCGLGYEDSFGGIDLYVSFKNADGSWSKGINLGEGVNSKFDDKFPALSPDGKYLFFVADKAPERTYIYSDKTYDELMELNLSGENGLGGDVYWVSADVIQRLNPHRSNLQTLTRRGKNEYN